MNVLVTILLGLIPGEGSASADDLNKAVKQLLNSETKQRATYQEVVQGYRKAGPITAKIKDVSHDIELLNAKLLSISGQGQGDDGRAAEANAKNALRDRIAELTRTKEKLEGDLKAKLDPVQ